MTLSVFPNFLSIKTKSVNKKNLPLAENVLTYFKNKLNILANGTDTRLLWIRL